MKNIFKMILLFLLVIGQVHAQPVVFLEDNTPVSVKKKKQDLVLSMIRHTAPALGGVLLTAISILIGYEKIPKAITKKKKGAISWSISSVIAAPFGIVWAFASGKKFYEKVQQYRQINNLKENSTSRN